MKQFLSIFAVLILGAAFLACDFGSNDEDTTAGEDDTFTQDLEGEGDTYVAGLENDWELVMIIDAEENTADTCNAGNPGADIDAVEIYRDGALFGWVNSVEAVDQAFVTPCDDNDKDDPDEMIGPADGTANSDDGFAGYFSLNGRDVVLLMSELMENGDELVVYEMYNADNPDATIEDYQVFLGYYTDEGDMAFTDDAITDWNTGLVTVTIDGLW